MAQDPSKTEKPTEKRLKKARNDGNVPRSQELSKVLVTLLGALALKILLGYMVAELLELWAWFFSEGVTFRATPKSIYTLFTKSIYTSAVILLPLMIFLAFVSFVLVRVQIGHLWTTKVLMPKFDKIVNIGANLKSRMMPSPENMLNILKSVGQALGIGIGPYIVLKNEWDNFAPLFYSPPAAIGAYMLELGFEMILYAMIPMLIIAAADLLFTRWKYIEDLKMSKDEVKDERRMAEGDEKVKGEQRQKMMDVMGRRMMQKVPEADVVVTNPTHYAVALQYNPMESPAPVVVAKGVDGVAQNIKEIAREHNVPIREDRELARALYSSVEIGDTIPEELYRAVATLLAQIAKVRNKHQPRG